MNTCAVAQAGSHASRGPTGPYSAVVYRGLEHLRVWVSAEILEAVPYGHQGPARFWGGCPSSPHPPSFNYSRGNEAMAGGEGQPAGESHTRKRPSPEALFSLDKSLLRSYYYFLKHPEISGDGDWDPRPHALLPGGRSNTGCCSLEGTQRLGMKGIRLCIRSHFSQFIWLQQPSRKI